MASESRMVQQIAEKIKYVRMAKGLTLKKLSDRTGLSVSFLSQVERAETSAAIPSLEKIADALGMAFPDFFTTDQERRYVLPVKDQSSLQKQEGFPAAFIQLQGSFPRQKLNPVLMILPPDYSGYNVPSQPGEKFYYVLEGEVLLLLDGQEHRLKAGDAAHFPAHLPHSWHNPLPGQTRVVGVLITD